MTEYVLCVGNLCHGYLGTFRSMKYCLDMDEDKAVDIFIKLAAIASDLEKDGDIPVTVWLPQNGVFRNRMEYGRDRVVAEICGGDWARMISSDLKRRAADELEHEFAEIFGEAHARRELGQVRGNVRARMVEGAHVLRGQVDAAIRSFPEWEAGVNRSRLPAGVEAIRVYPMSSFKLWNKVSSGWGFRLADVSDQPRQFVAEVRVRGRHGTRIMRSDSQDKAGGIPASVSILQSVPEERHPLFWDWERIDYQATNMTEALANELTLG